MARMVHCVKLGREAEGLDFPPYPGEMGKRHLRERLEGGVAGVAAPPDDARQREPAVAGRCPRAEVARRADGAALLRRRRRDALGLRAAEAVSARAMSDAADLALPGPRARRPARGRPRAHPRGAGEGGVRAERVPGARAPARGVPRVLRLSRRADAERCRPHQGRARDDRRRRRGRNDCLYCFVAHGAILRVYAKNPQVADQVGVNYRKADITPRQKRDARVRAQGCRAEQRGRRRRLRRAARARLHRRGHLGHRQHRGVLRLSNRMANLIGLRPNDEFYLLGRVPKRQ